MGWGYSRTTRIPAPALLAPAVKTRIVFRGSGALAKGVGVVPAIGAKLRGPKLRPGQGCGQGRARRRLP